MLPRPSGRFVHLMQSCRDPEGVHAAAAGTEPGGSRRHSLARAELQVSSKDLRVDERLSRAMPESNSGAMLPYGSIWVIHGARRSELMGSCDKTFPVKPACPVTHWYLSICCGWELLRRGDVFCSSTGGQQHQRKSPSSSGAAAESAKTGTGTGGE